MRLPSRARRWRGVKDKESWMSGGEVVLRGWEDKEDGGDGVLVEEEEKLIKEELEEKGHLEVEEEERGWHYIPIKEISHLADCRQHTKPRSTIQSYNATSPVQLQCLTCTIHLVLWYHDTSYEKTMPQNFPVVVESEIKHVVHHRHSSTHNFLCTGLWQGVQSPSIQLDIRF